MGKYKDMDANMIKLIAITAMTIDHVTWMVFPGYPKDFAPVFASMDLRSHLRR